VFRSRVRRFLPSLYIPTPTPRRCNNHWTREPPTYHLLPWPLAALSYIYTISHRDSSFTSSRPPGTQTRSIPSTCPNAAKEFHSWDRRHNLQAYPYSQGSQKRDAADGHLSTQRHYSRHSLSGDPGPRHSAYSLWPTSPTAPLTTALSSKLALWSIFPAQRPSSNKCLKPPPLSVPLVLMTIFLSLWLPRDHPAPQTNVFLLACIMPTTSCLL